MKWIIRFKVNGVARVETVEGTRDECQAGLARMMREYSAVTSFTHEEVPSPIEWLEYAERVVGMDVEDGRLTYREWKDAMDELDRLAVQAFGYELEVW
jgi:hypothetical protein